MNIKFLVKGRWYKTPCPTVLQSEEFSVKFFTDKHFILAHTVNKIVPSRESKMYFEKIDDMSLSSIKCDFHFNNRYNHPKEFLSNIYDTFDSFLNTSLLDDEKLLTEKRPVYKTTDEIFERILEIVTATDQETAEAEETTDPEVGQFVYDVRIHNEYGWDTYTVAGDDVESAIYKALKRFEYESGNEECSSIDVIRIYKEDSNELLKEIISKEREDSETATDANTSTEINNEYNETEEQFERLTGTLYKSLFKAIGLEEIRKISFIISNNMVFFNYNGVQYKYYPSQCKIFKKCGRKYQRINWRDFADDNSPTDQKQALGRSPPLLLI